MTAQQRRASAGALRKQTVVSLAVSPRVTQDGLVFATTEKASWSSQDGGHTWEQMKLPGSGLALAIGVSPTFHEDGLVWAGAAEGLVFLSKDRGQTWRDTVMAKVASPIAVFAASPTVAPGGVLMGGTIEDGVYRSLDQGRTWTLGNFGLLDLNVLALAVCPSYETEQVALVGTESALYRSRNGGLAWKEVAFWEDAVQTALFSPNFGTDRRAWAGTEGKGLHASSDGAVTWQRVESFPQEGVNVLGWAPLPQPALLAGTVNGLYASTDLGATWRPVLPGSNIMTLAVSGEGAETAVYAALEAGGLRRTIGKLDGWEAL